MRERIDLEQAQADADNLAELASLTASEAQVKEKLAAKTRPANRMTLRKRSCIAAQAPLDDANWKLAQTATTPGRWHRGRSCVAPGAIAAQFPMLPVMSFVLNEQWVVALFDQNEVREVEPGNRAEIALRTYPGRIIKCTVASVVWATAQGSLPISGGLPDTGVAPIPQGRLAVRLGVDDEDKDLFLAAGARGTGAIYTNGAKAIHILRKVLMRVHTKLDWLILKL